MSPSPILKDKMGRGQQNEQNNGPLIASQFLPLGSKHNGRPKVGGAGGRGAGVA